MRAWKKHKPKSIFLKARWQNSDFRHASSNQSSSKERYARSKFDFRPFGGSLVIFSPFCSTLTGNCGDGIDVSHRRKASETCLPESFSGFRSSTSTSSFCIHEGARWQFCRITHSPCSRPWAIAPSAFAPCPWPRDTDCVRSPMPSRCASRTISAMGSAPDDSTKISGVVAELPAKDLSRLKDGGSRNAAPSLVEMTSCSAMTVQSGRIASMTSALWRGVIWSLMAPGHRATVGESASNTSFQPSTWALKLWAKFCHGPWPSLSSTQTLLQLTSVSHSASGLGSSEPPPPRVSSSSCFSAAFRSPSTSMHLKQSNRENISLSFSNSESHVFSKSSDRNWPWRACKRFWIAVWAFRSDANFSAVAIASLYVP
mmetsp:Transcript_65388/g.173848  ORF Transcript_65388/g.173848 Transcript_65388/m.173848 type:complete len:371 (+) Transcript_65388:1511-2623(+)